MSKDDKVNEGKAGDRLDLSALSLMEDDSAPVGTEVEAEGESPEDASAETQEPKSPESKDKAEQRKSMDDAVLRRDELRLRLEELKKQQEDTDEETTILGEAEDDEELVTAATLKKMLGELIEQQNKGRDRDNHSREVQSTQKELDQAERKLQDAEFLAKFEADHPSDAGKGQEVLDQFDNRLSLINPNLPDDQRKRAAEQAIKDAYRAAGVGLEPEPKPKVTQDNKPPTSTEGTKFTSKSASSPDDNKPRAFDPTKMVLWSDDD